MLREARNYIFLRAPGASFHTHGQQGSGEKQRDVLQEESSYLEAVGRFQWRCPADSVPAVMDEVLRVIHQPRSQGGASGAGFGSKPRLHHVSPSWPSSCPRVLPSLSRVSGSPPGEPLCEPSGKLQPACLAFESSPRLCLFSLLFQTSFVPFWLS